MRPRLRKPGGGGERRGGRGETAGAEGRPRGGRVGGWAASDLSREPEASYAAAQELARDQGGALPVTAETLRRRLKEKGLLADTDRARRVLTVRRTLEGR